MFGTGSMEWIVILGIMPLVFGVGKLPQVGRILGQAIREFRGSLKNGEEPKVNEVSSVRLEPEVGRGGQV
jgi:sec-independent protein translocase protein TatA